MSEYSHFAGRSIFGVSLLQTVIGTASSSDLSSICSDLRKCSGCDCEQSRGSFSSSCSCRRFYRTRSTLSIEVEEDDDEKMLLDDVCSSSSLTKLNCLSSKSENRDDSAVETSIGAFGVEVEGLCRISVDSVIAIDDKKKLEHDDRLETSDPWTSSSRTVGSMQVDDSSTIEDLESCTLQTVATVETDLDEDPAPIEDKVAEKAKSELPKEELSSKPSKSKRKKARKTKLNDKLHKTELCKMYMKDGKCKFGKGCAFAHGESELHTPPPKHPKYKSIPCKNLKKKGFCPFGDKCVFIH